jgi:hypothetical protein
VSFWSFHAANARAARGMSCTRDPGIADAAVALGGSLEDRAAAGEGARMAQHEQAAASAHRRAIAGIGETDRCTGAC